MPCELIREARGLYRRFTGSVSSEELAGCLSEVANDERFDGLRYSIFDCPETREIDLRAADLETIAAPVLGGASSNARILAAFVTTNTTSCAVAGFRKQMGQRRTVGL